MQVCSRHRGGGVGISACCAGLCRAVPCRLWGGWGLVPSRAKCSYPTRSFVEAHMYQSFRFGRRFALFGDCCIASFCVLPLGVAPCVFQLIHGAVGGEGGGYFSGLCWACVNTTHEGGGYFSPPVCCVVLCCVVLCCVVLCCVVLCCVVLCCVVLCCVVLCCVVLCCVVLCCVVLCCVVLCCVVLYCVALRCVGLGWVVLWCGVLCCVVLCCVVLCCVGLGCVVLCCVVLGWVVVCCVLLCLGL